MDISDKWRMVICFLASLFAIWTTTEVIKAPTSIQPVIPLIQSNTLVAIVPVTHKNKVLTSRNEINVEYFLASKSWSLNEAKKIMMCESSGNPNAINRRDNHRVCKGSYGLFQIGCIHYDDRDLLDPKINIEMAYEIYKRRGGWHRDWIICSRKFDKY